MCSWPPSPEYAEKKRIRVMLHHPTPLANLREEVAETDGLFGINDSLASRFSGKSREELIVKIREKRWAVYVTRAVDRFQQWWETYLPESQLGSGEGGRFRMDDLLKPNDLEKTVLNAPPLEWRLPMLP